MPDKKIQRFKSSNAELAAALNYLAGEIELVANKNVHFGGKNVRFSNNKDSLEVEYFGGDGDGEATTNRPWDLYNITNTAGTSYDVKVRPGLVNGFLPSNALATFTVNAANEIYFKCKVITDGRKITSAVIEANGTQAVTNPPAKSAFPAEFTFIFAVFKEGRAYRTLGDGNPHITQTQVFSIPVASPSPGLPIYENWYSWSIS